MKTKAYSIDKDGFYGLYFPWDKKYAKDKNAELYTTSKDFVKIPLSLQKYLNVLEVAVVWDNPDALTVFIKEKLFAKDKK